MNYIDMTRYEADSGIGNFWIETGMGGSHYEDCHHVLFDGNWASNCTGDDTHGSVGYQTFYGNYCTGIRSTFVDNTMSDTNARGYNAGTAPCNGVTTQLWIVSDQDDCGYDKKTSTTSFISTERKRGAGIADFTYWQSFVNNVIGDTRASTAANLTHPGLGGWNYQCFGTTGSPVADYCDAHGPPLTNQGAVWLFSEYMDPNLIATPPTVPHYFRHGNWDTVNKTIVDWQPGFSHTMPNALFTDTTPSWWPSGYTYPWVNAQASNPSGVIASGPTTTNCTTNVGGPCSGLPAKARWDNGTPFVQPSGGGGGCIPGQLSTDLSGSCSLMPFLETFPL
jgi:hypothetical protein